jgi:TPR repeat protein
MKDFAIAVEWYRKAAEQGITRAYSKLKIKGKKLKDSYGT